VSVSSDDIQVAVLVLNLNGAHFLRDCFESLLRNIYPRFDIYLIDNHSSDDSVDLTRTHYPMVKIIRNRENLGFAGAYDQAIRTLDYEYLVLLNNDTTVNQRWLEALFAVAESNEHVGACSSKIVMMWDKTIIDHAGGMLTTIGSGLDLGKLTKDDGSYDTVRETGFGCGCSLLIRKSAYLDAGGFDPSYVIYHEDVDLCWKMRLLGYSIMFVGDSVVYHHVGGGKIQSIEHPVKTYLCQKNRLANIIKNMGTRKLAMALLVSSIYDAIRIARFGFLGRADLLKMLVKGYVDTFKNFGSLVRDRHVIQQRRCRSDEDLEEYFAPLLVSALNYRRMLKVKNPW
jgi:GT2 family glycosyltransferase